jgi:hypothetical protein
MELPIFRELESAWFRTSFDFEFGSTPLEPEAEPVAMAQSAPSRESMTTTAQPSVVPQQPSASQTSARPADVPRAAPAPAPLPPTVVGAGSQRSTRPSGGERRSPPESLWRGAADQGWRAAEAAAQPHVDVTTESGLPRRTPMAQLVPGGVEKPNSGVQKRSPEQVRGLLSAYHRGVQRGRSDGCNSNSGNPPHSGKEQE